MNPVFSKYGLKDLLPLKLDVPDEGCLRPNASMYCFEAGKLFIYLFFLITCNLSSNGLFIQVKFE